VVCFCGIDQQGHRQPKSIGMKGRDIDVRIEAEEVTLDKRHGKGGRGWGCMVKSHMDSTHKEGLTT
jgi:hypothetical protein